MDCIVDNLSLSLFRPEELYDSSNIKDLAFQATSSLVTSLIIYDHLFYDDNINFDMYNQELIFEYCHHMDKVIRRDTAEAIKQAEERIIKIEIPENIQRNAVGIALEEFKRLENNNFFSKVVIFGAIRYTMLSKMLGLNYISAPQRNEFLINNRVTDFISAPDYVLNRMENEVQKFINSINSELGIDRVNIKIPLLSQYLIQNIKKDKNIIKEAIKLSNTKEIKEFKKWLSDFQNALNSYNMYEVKKCLSIVDESIRLMKKEFKTKKQEISFTISFSPSIGSFLPSFNGNIQLPFTFNRNKIVMTLVKKICVAGLKNPLGLTKYKGIKIT